MTEKDLYALARTLSAAMSEIQKGGSEPGPLTTLRRLRKYADQYEGTKRKVDS